MLKNIGLCRYVFLVFLSIVIMPAVSHSEEPETDIKKHWYSGIILDIGVTASQIQLDVDKVFEDGKGKSLKFGIGVGVGYLEVEGDIILTDLEDGSQEKHDFDVSTDPVDLAAFVMMDVRYNKWLLRIRGGGPWIVNWGQQDGYKFGLFDISMSLAYSFHL